MIEHIAEVALIFALFSSGLKLDRPLRWREWGSVTRLLVLAMPLTMAGIALFGTQVMGLSLGAALLLGAMLSPTDPVLAGDIGVGPPGDEAEHEPNFALTAEAGGNDGLAAPLVLIGIFVAEEGGTGWIDKWLVADLALRLRGRRGDRRRRRAAAAAWSVHWLRDRELLAPAFDGYHAVATALVLYGAAETAGGYGFLAVFVGGLAFRRYEHDHELNGRVHAGAEQVEKFMELAAILLLGSLLTGAGLTAPGWEGWLLAIVLLVVIRPLSVFISLIRSQVETAGGRTFVAWFGVRGVGTLYYAATVVDRGRPLRRRAEARGVDRDRLRDRLHRRPRRDGRARAEAAVPRACARRRRAAAEPTSGRDPLQSRRRLPLVEQVEHGLLDHRLVDRQLARLRRCRRSPRARRG